MVTELTQLFRLCAKWPAPRHREAAAQCGPGSELLQGQFKMHSVAAAGDSGERTPFDKPELPRPTA